jgi:hypothetical protein
VRKKSAEILRVLLTEQSRSAIFGLHADLRKLTQAELGGVLEVLVSSAPERAPNVPRAGDGSPVSRILHLLRSEANLTDTEAIVELERELRDNAGFSGLPESESLEKWVRGACEIAPAGEILGAALTVVERAQAGQKGKVRPGRRRQKGRRSES